MKTNKRVELEQRTKRFALQTIEFASGFRRAKAAEVIAYQIVKSATSIGANYREAGRASSKNDFIHKMSIVEREAAETQYWLELCHEGGFGEPVEAVRLLAECSELLAIFTAIGRTSRDNNGQVSEEEGSFDPS
jgi:four helix bundle protein